MEYSLSDHAELVISERGIKLLYIERTLETPSLIADDRIDKELQHRLRVIPEYEDRILRVIVNVSKNPIHIVTAYFDRSMRGKL
ncbi:MAG: hypothetical protein A3J97_14155 [Spirochaetes bacterium RIFOXYC1_FULL_54_7]|nr:MAG: hypothetical protein A3J97_14155 [Spirochaetes bacterium RIFOXYC1_FULL_54_7]